MDIQYSQELIERGQKNLQIHSNLEQIPKQDQKRKYIGIIIILSLILGISACIVLSTKQRESVVPKWQLNTKTQFSSKDQICVNSVSQQGNQCTQIEAQTTLITTEINEQNSKHILLLNGLKAQKENEMMSSDDILQQDVRFNYQINENQQINITKEDYQKLSKIPMIQFTTDNLTGEILSINIPNNISDLYVQTLITNILHLGANTQEVEIINNEIKNVYHVGNLQFLPKRTINEYYNGEIEITKQVTKDDKLNGQGVHSFFEEFEQIQTTILDKNNQIQESIITVQTTIDTTIRSTQENMYNKIEQILTVRDQSKLNKISEEQDAFITQLLLPYYQYQQYQQYTLQTLQDRMFQNRNELIYQQQNQRLLRQSKSTATCTNEKFSVNTNENILTVDVMNKQIGLQAKVKGSGTDSDFDATIKACISVDNICVHSFATDSIDYDGQLINIKDYEWNHVKTDDLWDELFHAQWMILGFTAQAGTKFVYGYGFDQKTISQNSNKGLVDTLYAVVLLNNYAEVDVDWMLGLRAGVVAEIFRGDITSEVLFGYDATSNAIALNESAIKITASFDALQLNVYSQWRHLSAEFAQGCIDVQKWLQVCIPEPTHIWLSEWKNIYTATFGFKVLTHNYELFNFQSQCYAQ